MREILLFSEFPKSRAKELIDNDKRPESKASFQKITEKESERSMEPKDYTVVKIEGEYAYLRADGETNVEDLFIAMALLPSGIDVGTRLHCEMLCYTVIE